MKASEISSERVRGLFRWFSFGRALRLLIIRAYWIGVMDAHRHHFAELLKLQKRQVLPVRENAIIELDQVIFIPPVNGRTVH